MPHTIPSNILAICWPAAMSANPIHIISLSCAGVVGLLMCSTDCIVDIVASEKDLKHS